MENGAARATNLGYFSQGPAYAHPRRVALVPRLPLNGVGKIDRTMVGEMAEALFGTTLGEHS